MKHLILMACFALLGLTANAQTAMTASGTLTNATTGYVSGKVAGGYGNLAIQVVVAKTSGTVAGKVTLEASNDGTNYARINTTDSLNLTDVASQTKLFNVGISPYLYYRVNVTTSGTQVSSATGTYIFRAHP